MKKLTIICLLALLSVACSKEEPVGGMSEGEGIVLRFVPEETTEIETRTATPNMASADGRIEQVIVYAFEAGSGDLVVKQRQELEYPDNEVRMMLPTNRGDLSLHAVCNTSDEWFDGVTNAAQFNERLITIERPGEAFKGSLMMYGQLDAPVANLENKNYVHKIYCRRLASRISFDIRFTPDVPTDKFYLTQIKAYNLPDRSWLVGRDGSKSPAAADYEWVSNDGDAVYDASAGVMGARYLQDYRLNHTEAGANRYTANFYQFENRRGGLDDDPKWFDRISDGNPDKANLQQIFKGEYGDQYFPLGSYVLIEGTYVADNGSLTLDAKYKIYLGASNDRDFNIKRNSRYTYTVTIRTCDELDTRVTRTSLSQAQITPSFTSPLDAHCNSARCFGFSENDWEIYVENPDSIPWLEISFASRYKPQTAGQPATADCATTRLSGTGALLDYFYIHTDEYVPEINSEAGNVAGEAGYRSGVVVLRDKVNGSESRITITQRPAQLVRLPKKDLLGQPTGEYHEFYVEHTLEEKNLQWGFLKYPANPVMTSMINDRWDGLSNTRKLYDEAVRKEGMYNPGSADPNTIEIPKDIALGYAVNKNRDRDGNGRIDRDEIVWYLPALDEVAELKRVMLENNLVFEDPQDKFWSSTPYLAGYTDEIPGRAFYVKMNKGEKAFAMRNRNYNVICCRRKGAWMGNNDSGAGGNVDIDDGWNDEEEIMPIK